MSLWLLLIPSLGMVVTSSGGYAPGCSKEYLSSCVAQLPNTKGIPTTAAALDTSCHGFTSGMKCMKNYTSNCLEEDRRKWFESAVAGAIATFTMLCGNQEIRKQYLIHSQCFREKGVTESWEHCVGHFVTILREEMSRRSSKEDQILELCCARFAFLRCVTASAKHKCGSSSANLLGGLAETLSSVSFQLKMCSNFSVDFTHCSGAAVAAVAAEPAALASLLVALAYLWHDSRHAV